MLIRKFVSEIDDDYGSFGWRPKWQPTFNALRGIAVAHDCLEHFPNDDASVEAELQALGASWFIRGETGYFFDYGWGDRDPVRNIAAEISQLVEETLNAGQLLPEPPSARPLDAGVERMLKRVAAAGIDDAQTEWRHRGTDEPFPADWNVRSVLGWLRLGYRKAKRRYRHISQYQVKEVFWQIEKGADRLLREVEGTEGLTMIVSVNLRRGTVKCRIADPGFEYLQY